MRDIDPSKISLNPKVYKLANFNQTNTYCVYGGQSRHTIQFPKRMSTNGGIANYQGGNTYSLTLDFKTVDGKLFHDEGIVRATDPVEGRLLQKLVDIDRRVRELANLDSTWIWFSPIRCTEKNDREGNPTGEYWPPSVKLNLVRNYEKDELDVTCTNGTNRDANKVSGAKHGEAAYKPEKVDWTDVVGGSDVLPVISIGKIYKRPQTAPKPSEAGLHLFLNRVSFWPPMEPIENEEEIYYEEEDQRGQQAPAEKFFDEEEGDDKLDR
jgi:hypothetical protein